MEKSTCRLRIVARNDRDVVHSGRYFLRMESVWSGFRFMGAWETSVEAQPSAFAVADEYPSLQRVQERVCFGTLTYGYFRLKNS